MNRLIKLGLLSSLVAVCLGAAMTIQFRHQPHRRPTERDLYSVVNRQLAAFRAADFASAYQFAALGLQQKFSRNEFERMIRHDFSSMTRAARVEFGAMRINETGALAQVFLTTADGSTRVYVYRFVAENGSWKIDGVQPLGERRLTRLPGVPI